MCGVDSIVGNRQIDVDEFSGSILIGLNAAYFCGGKKDILRSIGFKIGANGTPVG